MALPDFLTNNTCPTAEDVKAALGGLIDGSLSRDEVTAWAMKWYTDDHKAIDDWRVARGLAWLSGVDTPTPGHDPLFDTSDFRDWRDELFPEETPTDEGA